MAAGNKVLFLALCGDQSLLHLFLIMWFFLWIVFLYTWADQYTADNFRALICRSPEFPLFVVFSFLVLYFVTTFLLFSPKNFSSILSSQVIFQLYLGSSSLSCSLETLTAVSYSNHNCWAHLIYFQSLAILYF